MSLGTDFDESETSAGGKRKRGDGHAYGGRPCIAEAGTLAPRLVSGRDSAAVGYCSWIRYRPGTLPGTTSTG